MLFHLLVVGLLLLPVASSMSLEQLSVLEYSLKGSKSQKCDLVLIGPDLAVDVERSTIRLSRERTYVIRKSLVALSNCLILVIRDEFSVLELKNLAENLMKIKPVGVVYEGKKHLRLLANDVEHHTWPFPLIFEKVNGKSNKLTMTSEDESYCYRRRGHPLP